MRIPRYINACDILYKLTGEGCCVSCAEDSADGQMLIDIEDPKSRYIAEVCCIHSQMVSKHHPRLWWAILLNLFRRNQCQTK